MRNAYTVSDGKPEGKVDLRDLNIGNVCLREIRLDADR